VPENHFANHAEFDEFMRAIDAEMRAEEIPIPARELRGHSRAAMKLKTTIRGGPLENRDPVEGVYAGDDLSLHIRKWFRTKYGDRLNVDFSPGTVPVLIDGDAYAMALPRVYGTVRLVCDPSSHGANIGSAVGVGGVPPIFNVLNSIKGLTPANSMTLSARDLALLTAHFRSALGSFAWIEHAPKNQLIEAGVADLAAAAQSLLAKPHHFGLSRWAALHATEKFYKAYIAMKESSFDYIHDLDKLDGAAQALGFQGLSDRVLELIRCRPAVRYDGSTSTLVQAVEACQTSIFACGSLAQQMAVSEAT
jgi:hypothetical protein